MNKNGVHTAEMLPAIIVGLRQKGFEFVTVGELLHTQQRTAKEDMKRGNGEPVNR